MASDLNRCEFIGRLGADPDVKTLDSGNTVANFRIACGEKWKGKDGQIHEKTEWIPIVVWGKLAEICGQYLRRGSRIFISGKFATRKWVGNDGNDRYTTECIVDGFSGHMQMLDGKPQGEQVQAQQQTAGAAAPAKPAAQPTQAPPVGGGLDDDIPFNNRHYHE